MSQKSSKLFFTLLILLGLSTFVISYILVQVPSSKDKSTVLVEKKSEKKTKVLPSGSSIQTGINILDKLLKDNNKKNQISIKTIKHHISNIAQENADAYGSLIKICQKHNSNTFLQKELFDIISKLKSSQKIAGDEYAGIKPR